MNVSADPPRPLELTLGVRLWREALTRDEQSSLVADVLRRVAAAPFYRPTMPRSERPFSVEETNFGSLGWYSDKSGYRYEPLHPHTKQAWPPIPETLIALWHRLT